MRGKERRPGVGVVPDGAFGCLLRGWRGIGSGRFLHGILIETGPGEAWRLAAARCRLLDDPGLCDAMGQGGRRKVAAEYDRRQSRQAYRDLLAEP